MYQDYIFMRHSYLFEMHCNSEKEYYRRKNTCDLQECGANSNTFAERSCLTSSKLPYAIPRKRCTTTKRSHLALAASSCRPSGVEKSHSISLKRLQH